MTEVSERKTSEDDKEAVEAVKKALQAASLGEAAGAPTNPSNGQCPPKAPSTSSHPIQHPPRQERWGTWHQPDVSDVAVRSKDYLTSGVKTASQATPLLELAWLDFFHMEKRVDHIASHKLSWLNKPNLPAELKDRFYFVVNIQVAAMGLCFAMYFAFNKDGKTGDETVDKLWEKYVSDTDSYRDNRLKMIPLMTAGPWLARKAVPCRPVIIGNKVKNRYFKGKNYFETDIETDSSTIAKSILKLLQGYNNYSCSLIWILEGKSPMELPERILAAANLGNPDYKKAVIMDSEAVEEVD